MMAIYFMHYNFMRIHQTVTITPAMAARVTPKLWEMSDPVKVLEDWENARRQLPGFTGIIFLGLINVGLQEVVWVF
jgi:hypothetical protein